jgi:hypothetical protein
MVTGSILSPSIPSRWGAWEPLSENECDVSCVEANEADEYDDYASREESGPDESVFWLDDDLRAWVTSLIQADSCDAHYLRRKPADFENFLSSIDRMRSKEKKQTRKSNWRTRRRRCAERPPRKGRRWLLPQLKPKK